MIRIEPYLQPRLYDLLTSDTALTTLLGGASVYDYVDDNTAMPYVTIGDIVQDSDFGGHDFSGFEGEYSIHVWSEAAGRKEAQSILNRIYEILHGRDLRLPAGFNTISNRCTFNEIVRDPDGKTYHGVQRYSLQTGGN